MKFLIATGLVVGFVSASGYIWYVNWSPQAQAHGRPMVGPDAIVMSGIVGAFWGGLLAATAGLVYRKLRERHKISVAELIRQTENASSEDQGVWPPPPIDRTADEGNPR